MDAKKINTILDDFESNNPKLYAHSERVAKICYAFAQELNLTFEEREIAYYSGMLHDIGKYYLKEIENFEINGKIENAVSCSMLYIDDEFSKLIPIINNFSNIKEEDCENYSYNVNVIKLILTLANKYDVYRVKGLSHEATCSKLRKNYQNCNGMVTVLLKTIIKNKLNHDY